MNSCEWAAKRRDELLVAALRAQEAKKERGARRIAFQKAKRKGRRKARS